MINYFQGQRFRLYCSLIVVSLFVLPNIVLGQSGLKLQKPNQTVDLFEEELFGWQKYVIDSTFFDLDRDISLYKRTVTFDSAGTFVSIQEKLDDTEFYFPAVVDIETYINSRLEFNSRQLFVKKRIQFFSNIKEKEFGALELDIPVRIRSETFKRIFGSDKISLRVTGNISFDISGRTEDRGGSAINAQESKNNFSPRFNQTQQFTVEGKIGEKVTVSIEQNSEATTDIENTLKLRYDGEDDEIIQTIEAGNISLSLPSTKYVIFGGSNKGLFGLKTQMKLGNLHVTAIASLEKGQQQELSISGGASTSRTNINDIDYIKDRYFFVNEDYRNWWDIGFKQIESQKYRTFTAPAFQISQLDVWITTTSQGKEEGEKPGKAMLNPQNANDPVLADATFRVLREDEYTFDSYTGILRVNQTVAPSNVLAVSYRIGNNTETVGDLSTAGTDSVRLKLVKINNQNVASPTWNLSMKNVYSLGGSQIQKEGFKLNIFQDRKQELVQDGIPYLEVFGLDITNADQGGEADGEFDVKSPFIDFFNGTLIFPDHTPFDPSSSDFITLLDENKVKVYNMTNPDSIRQASKFEIQIEAISTKSIFDLGFYVLEGSEVVSLGSKDLVRDRDYTIDYFSGQLSLISDEAKRSSSNINIKYERANLFQLDKKTILGGRAEYRFLDNSFIGATALYLNKTTVDTRVRVGQEPFQNFVWDINAAFKFKPRFLTRAMDALPLIETNDESHFDIEGEFAQVIPDPNTLNSSKTGDDNGVAYIDDFEASKRTTTLGIGYRTWTQASAPVKLPAFNDPLMPEELDKTRAHMAWFNPFNQTLIQDVWPNRDVNSQTGRTMDVLALEYYRDAGSDADSSWAGIMRSTEGFADQQQTKYIELWLNGTVGTVHIDIGEISEDWWVRGQTHDGRLSLGGLNREDKDELGIYKDEFDLGIDGVNDSANVSNDDWYEVRDTDNSRRHYDNRDYRGLNGTEGNGNIKGARYPDSEDLNSNENLDTRNNYFTYSFSLDPDDEAVHGFVTGRTEGTGWRQFRIPINQWQQKVGNPDLQTIVNTRIRIGDIPETEFLESPRLFIATLDFVGNEWNELGYREYSANDLPPGAVDDDGNIIEAFKKDEEIFEVTTYNSEENAVDLGGEDSPDRYVSPPGVSGERDKVTDTISKEQSLVMKFKNGLPPNHVAEVRKTLYSKIQLVNYKRLKMFVYGSKRRLSGNNIILPDEPGKESDVVFYMRFGSDEKNYYEYGKEISQGWENNNIDIDLAELAALDGSINEFKQKGNEYLLAKGSKASLNSIHYFIFGVRNKSTSKRFKGEIWLDEMRISDVRGEIASALRLKTALKLADVMSFTAEWESKDADFHNISTQFGTGSTLESQNYTAKLNFDKFLPATWDMSIPIDARLSFSRNVPKYLPVSDDLTGYRNNSFSKKIESLFGLRDLSKELEDAISTSETKGAGTTIRKKGKSKHWLPKYTIDQLTLDFDFSESVRTSELEKYAKTTSYRERYDFGIPFEKDNYVEPLGFVKEIPLLDNMHLTKLYYSPSSIKLSLSVSDAVNRSQKRNVALPTFSRNTGTTRSVSMDYKLLHNFNVKYSRTHITDADFDSLSRLELYENMFTKLDFGKETNIKQSFNTDFKPEIFSWMSTDFSFDTDFSYQLINNYQHISAQNNVSKTISSNVSPSKLMNLIYTPPKEAKKNKSSSRRPKRNQEKTEEEKDENESDDKKLEKENNQDNEDDKDESKGLEILPVIYSMFDSWKSIKVSYSRKDGVSDNYLESFPNFAYQFGFNGDPGVSQDQSLIDQGFKLQKQNRRKTNTLRTSTNLKFGKLNADFNHDYNDEASISNDGETRSKSKATSYLALGNDPKKDFKGLESDLKRFVPSWNVSFPGVEEFLFFKAFAKSISLSHSHSGKYDEKERFNGTGFVPSSQTFSNNWAPLIGINIKTIWDVATDIRMNDNTNYSYSAGGDASRSENSSFSVSLNYSKTAGFKIPLPFWPFEGRTFKNEINFSASFDATNNKTFFKSPGTDSFKEQTSSSSWKLRPNVSYKFNTRVTGSMFFETGENKSKTTGTYTWSEFGITVNIAIRD